MNFALISEDFLKKLFYFREFCDIIFEVTLVSVKTEET